MSAETALPPGTPIPLAELTPLDQATPVRSDVRVWSGLGVLAVSVVMLSVTPLLTMNFIPGRNSTLGIVWAALIFGMIIASGTLFAAAATDRLKYAHGRGDKALVYLLLAGVGVSTGVLALAGALTAWWLYFGLGVAQ